MPPLLWLGPVLELALLIGLLARRRLPHCRALALSVCAWFVSDLSVAVWPSLNTWTFWIAKETAHAALALVLGVELSLLLLAAVPLGQLAARRWLVALLAFAAVLVTTSAPDAISVLARLWAAIAWLYLGLALVAARYVVPLTRLHRAVLLALSPCCMLYWLTWRKVEADVATAALVNPVAFVVVLGVLLWAAWTDDPEPPVEPALVRLVWPWTA